MQCKKSKDCPYSHLGKWNENYRRLSSQWFCLRVLWIIGNAHKIFKMGYNKRIF
jgi:hypothetical protein